MTSTGRDWGKVGALAGVVGVVVAVLGVVVAILIAVVQYWLSPPGSAQPPQPIPLASQPASPDHGEHILGGVDVERYCQENFHLHAVLREDNAYGWRCNSNPNFTSGVRSDDTGVSMTDACRQEYGRTDAYDQYGSFRDPYSWKCYYRD